MTTHHADVAQLVEHNLAKVGVASSNLVVRSMEPRRTGGVSWFPTSPNDPPTSKAPEMAAVDGAYWLFYAAGPFNGGRRYEQAALQRPGGPVHAAD